MRHSIITSSDTWDRALLAVIALSSFAALLLELALTRLFSVVLFYHFAFLAISIALLGLGAGAVFAHLKKRWLARFETRGLLAWLCAMNALIVPVVLMVVLHTPISLLLSKANFLRLIAIYVASTVPFFTTGLQFSLVFARGGANIAPLYAADLVGGARWLAWRWSLYSIGWVDRTPCFSPGCVWPSPEPCRRQATGRGSLLPPARYFC